jgi:hypothetical protein
MAQLSQVGSLDIGQDLEYEQRALKIQKVAFVIWALLLIAALAGLCGPGPLSQATTSTPDKAVQVQYNRFARMQAPTDLEVHLGPGVAKEGHVPITLSDQYAENVEVRSVTPQPSGTHVGADGVTYSYDVPDAGQPGLVVFHLHPEKMGRLNGEIKVGDQPPLSFSQIVYP